MLTIQTVGSEILTDNPRKLYALCGPEYGIKCVYLNKLNNLYGNKIECINYDQLISAASTKHVFKPSPAVYVVRYDEKLIAALTPEVANKLKNFSLPGTLVLMYESQSATNKLDKYLPDNTVVVDYVDSRYISKYLHSDFPNLPDRLIDISNEISVNYGHARRIASAMTYSSISKLFQKSEDELKFLFGVEQVCSDKKIKHAILSRNYRYAVSLLENCSDLDGYIYSTLSACAEMDKILSNRYIDSEFSPYRKLWTNEDCYNLFMIAYDCLIKSRTIWSDKLSLCMMICSVIMFKNIPGVEQLN